MVIRHPLLTVYRLISLFSFIIFPVIFMVIRLQFTVDHQVAIIFLFSCIVSFICSYQLLSRFADYLYAFTGIGIHLFLLFLFTCY